MWPAFTLSSAQKGQCLQQHACAAHPECIIGSYAGPLVYLQDVSCFRRRRRTHIYRFLGARATRPARGWWVEGGGGGAHQKLKAEVSSTGTTMHHAYTVCQYCTSKHKTEHHCLLITKIKVGMKPHGSKQVTEGIKKLKKILRMVGDVVSTACAQMYRHLLVNESHKQSRGDWSS